MFSSRFFFSTVVVLSIALGCNDVPFDGPTVDQFDGRLVKDGQPVQFPAGESVILRLVHHESAESFGVPIKEDGSFDIGWMPIGAYSARLERKGRAATGGSARGPSTPPPRDYEVPGGMKIVEGQTQYDVELGKGFKL